MESEEDFGLYVKWREGKIKLSPQEVIFHAGFKLAASTRLGLNWMSLDNKKLWKFIREKNLK